MRLQLLCGLVLLGTILFGQRSLLVTWQSTSGVVDSGRLKKIPSRFMDDSELVFYKENQDEIAISPERVDWVIYNSDTILQRRHHNSRYLFMQLLYKGEVRLYKVIQSWAYPQYYLVRGEQWEQLNHLVPKEAGYRILRQNCRGFKPAKRIRNDYQAVAVAQQINDCLGVEKHAPIETLTNFRNQMGISYNLPAKPYSRFDDRNRGYPGNPSKYWPIYPPSLSLFYERQVFPYRTWLKAQLNVVFIHRDNQEYSKLVYPGNTYQVKEAFEYTAFQFYPGLNFATTPKKRLQFRLGLGAVFTAPLASRRVVTLQKPISIPNIPVKQEFINIVATDSGYYAQTGAQFRVHRTFQLGLNFRIESSHQYLRHENIGSDYILYSRSFSERAHIARNTVYRLQMQVAYSW
ncbi:hypothetical protein [Lewinella cohaerens]|uniref:hypothetical protein n=1 Tax=Lewinella cohaerens TaxID=70995 RepID=UPI00039D7B46|nr:hypothetical protein [Lewinella cohaerens]